MREFSVRVARLARFSSLLKEFGFPNYDAARLALGLGKTHRKSWGARFAQIRKQLPVREQILKSHVTVQASNGKVYKGPMHAVAAMDMKAERPGDYAWMAADHRRAERASGFATTHREHVPAAEATRLAKREHRWKPGNEAWRKNARPGLHSQDLPGLKQSRVP